MGWSLVVNMSRVRRKPTMNELQHHHDSGCSHFWILPTAGKSQLKLKKRLPTLLGQFQWNCWNHSFPREGGKGFVCFGSGEPCRGNAHWLQPCTTAPIEGTFSVSSPSQHTVSKLPQSGIGAVSPASMLGSIKAKKKHRFIKKLIFKT